MRYTLFAGLTQLDPLDPLSTDDYSFQTINPDIIDRLLEVGAVTHRHDGHPALATPTSAPPCEVIASGGQVPGGVTFDFAYTLIDEDRGETAASPICSTTTPEPISAPVFSPDATADYTAGQLTADAYYYAETWIDADGGETTLGAISPVDVDPFPNARVLLSGLASGMPAGAVGWRLYRARGGENFHYISSGTADTLIDDGTLCAQCQVFPPTVNSTTQTATLRVVIPPLPSTAAAWKLYGRVQSLAWPSKSLMASGAVGSAAQVFAVFSPELGKPPPRSLALRGAQQIDPDTDILDWHWKRPVDTFLDLPTGSGAASGDARVALDNGTIYTYVNGAWGAAGGGGGGGGGPEAVDSYDSVPASGVVPVATGGGPGDEGVLDLVFEVDSYANIDNDVVDEMEFSFWLTPDSGSPDISLYLLPPGVTSIDDPQAFNICSPSSFYAGTASAASGRAHITHHADRNHAEFPGPFDGLMQPGHTDCFLAQRGREATGTWTVRVANFDLTDTATLRVATLHLKRGIRREGHTFTIMGDVVASGTAAIPVMPVAIHRNCEGRLVKLRHKLASGAASGVLKKNGTTIVSGLTFDTNAETVYVHQPLAPDDELELVINTLFGSPKGLSATLHLEQTTPPPPRASI